ncbi:MAG TPA: helix-turn-helix transcriptional regulator [Candidatus Nanopelagicales bacterium]|nr:helix-turn-helix transcriptional regulator [Candidatus Nanopelagicales bacterium]
MLGAVGLGPDEEDVYRRLVLAGDSAPAALAADADLPLAELDAVLDRLVDRGLAVRRPDGVCSAAPPAIALGALLREQRDALYSAELDLAELADAHRSATSGRVPSDVVEVLTDVDAVRHRFAQVQQGAQREVRSMMVPNLTVVPYDDNDAGYEALRRGVRYRAILDRAALGEPGIVKAILRDLARGEQIRVADHVPVKMLIADDALAMLPLSAERNTAPESLLVHAGGLLSALTTYFELSWERAYPLWPNRAGDELVELRPGEIDELDGQILALLLAGMTDQALAGQLGLSLRTVQRRIRVLMDKAGVDTRIQLGWHAGREGWA